MLRGFSAFDLFLEQHPEFTERVTFIAQLMPSRTDVPQYAEYLERIEALVAVVNHRHGTPDWMPIQLKLRDDLEEAMAAYKHYDVLLVNAMFDGMNLVAKEGPIVNEREGVSILSENTGAHEELGEYALSVNPFDIQELANSIYAALTMAPAESAGAREGLRRDRHLARPRRLDRRAARRHPREGPDAANLAAQRPRAPVYDPARTDIRPRAAARPAGRGRRARQDRRRHARGDRGAGRAAAPRRVGRARAGLPDRAQGERRVPPAAVPRRPTPSCSSGLDRTLRIADGVLRFRIIKLAPGVPAAPGHEQRRRAAARPRLARRSAAEPPPDAPTGAGATRRADAAPRGARRQAPPPDAAPAERRPAEAPRRQPRPQPDAELAVGEPS